MSVPKISVIIPMYNRKHYIADAINSVLNQTFQDFEIIVRDDGSTDGSFDFVRQRYAEEISSDKIKLRRNEKNIGEFPTDNRLLREAMGKYIMVLHSDDLYLPHALEHMYGIAEQVNADVVHECNYFTTAPDGIIESEKSLTLVHYDKHQVNKIEIMSDDPFARFNEWSNRDMGIDTQHNIFNKRFLIENDLRFESFGGSLTGGNRLLALKWLMKAKVFVKTPIPCYVYRNSPDSRTNSKFSIEQVAQCIADQIKMSRHLDDYFASDDFFKDKPDFQYRVRNHLFMTFDNHWINRRGVYKNGITPELNRAVEKSFKKYFGDDAAFPIFLFHWIHAAMYGHQADIIIPPPQSI